MFSNLKVNNSDSGNILMSLKQDNDSSGIKTGTADFYSMVMDYSHETIRKDNNERNNLNEIVSMNDKTGPAERTADHRPDSNEHTATDYSADRNESSVRAAGNEDKAVNKNETQHSVKEKKAGTDSKDEKEINDFLDSAAGEMLMKKITELVKGSVKGNTEDLMKKFSKLADEVLSFAKKKISSANGFSIPLTVDKTGINKENPTVLNDFLDKLGRELTKLTSGKRGNDKVPAFTEKEMKEAIVAIIDDIKKGKNRIHDKAEIRKADNDEVRIERKNEINSESIVVKKKESGSDSGFDLNAGKEKNGNRESGSFSSGKVDTFAKNSFEKNDQLIKSPEFRQSLQEIIDKSKISVRDSNNATFSVKLFPKDLGSVNVNLLMENGVVSGRFLVESEDARNLLLNNLGELKEQLAEAGIQLGEFNVNVNQGGERFAAKEEEQVKTAHPARLESEAAVVQYDYNSSAAHNGHINMVI